MNEGMTDKAKVVNCENVVEMFSGYYDGDDTLPLGKINAHLTQCESCRKEYEAFASLINDVRNLPAPDVPHGFYQTMLDYVASRKVNVASQVYKKPRRRRLLSGYVSTSAIAAALVLLFMWATPPTVENSIISHQNQAIETGIETEDGYIPIAPMHGRATVPIYPIYEPPVPEPQRNNLLLIPAIGFFMLGAAGGVVIVMQKIADKKSLNLK